MIKTALMRSEESHPAKRRPCRSGAVESSGVLPLAKRHFFRHTVSYDFDAVSQTDTANIRVTMWPYFIRLSAHTHLRSRFVRKKQQGYMQWCVYEPIVLSRDKDFCRPNITVHGCPNKKKTCADKRQYSWNHHDQLSRVAQIR